MNENIISLPKEKVIEVGYLMKLMAGSDLVSQFIMLLLLFGSIVSLAIILNKYFQYSSLKSKMKSFEDNLWSAQSMHQSYSRVKKLPDNPCTMIFRAGMEELDILTSIKDTSLRSFMLLQAMNLVRNAEVDKLEKSLTTLATIGSYAPFIGLFGMIWGVINSFQSISAAKHASIAVVAPGMSEALFVTAVGIAVALPASIFYNILSSNLNFIVNQFDDFISRIHIALIKESLN